MDMQIITIGKKHSDAAFSIKDTAISLNIRRKCNEKMENDAFMSCLFS